MRSPTVTGTNLDLVVGADDRHHVLALDFGNRTLRHQQRTLGHRHRCRTLPYWPGRSRLSGLGKSAATLKVPVDTSTWRLSTDVWPG
jgi:hypothetical protein